MKTSLSTSVAGSSQQQRPRDSATLTYRMTIVRCIIFNFTNNVTHVSAMYQHISRSFFVILLFLLSLLDCRLRCGLCHKHTNLTRLQLNQFIHPTHVCFSLEILNFYLIWHLSSRCLFVLNINSHRLH